MDRNGRERDGFRCEGVVSRRSDGGTVLVDAWNPHTNPTGRKRSSDRRVILSSLRSMQPNLARL
jgi:hypothetical protein